MSVLYRSPQNSKVRSNYSFLWILACGTYEQIVYQKQTQQPKIKIFTTYTIAPLSPSTLSAVETDEHKISIGLSAEFIAVTHRLNMALDLQSVQLYSLAETPATSPLPPAFGLIYEGDIGQPR